MLCGHLVVDESGIDTVIPACFGHRACGLPAQGNLWDGQGQVQALRVEFGVGLGYQGGQVQAAVVAGQWHFEGFFAQV
ncbi:hypothetical protein D3C76_1085840 [compost metagenome]